MPPLLRLSGLEPFTLTPDIPFVNVGERTNVTGSAKFRKLIKAAIMPPRSRSRAIRSRTARRSSTSTWTRACSTRPRRWSFLNLIAAEPDIARVPVMIDSSKWEVIEAGLKCVQGKPVVNSISMKEGEEKFLRAGAPVQTPMAPPSW
jgi:5-methyltetrahydrofolate--homocysteine methyltransferase